MKQDTWHSIIGRAMPYHLSHRRATLASGITSSLPNVVAVATAPNYGRFAVGPVEPGIGMTLGNALRRILLSSLPGSAVTACGYKTYTMSSRAYHMCAKT